MPLILDALTYYDDDSDFGEMEGESSGSHEYREIILQQSVTMLAYMDRANNVSALPSNSSEPGMLLGFAITDLTILVAASIGAAGLITIVLAVFIVWHCCKLRGRPDKAYCLDNSSADECSIKQGSGTMMHSDSVVFLGSKSSQIATCAIGIKNDLCQSILTRSQSVPLKEGKEPSKLHSINRQSSKKRPVSQPVHLPIFQSNLYSPKRAHSVHPHYYHHLEDAAELSMPLPSIPEMAFRGSDDTPPQVLYASCNALDGASAYSSIYTAVNPNTTMKTRSLPLWGRARPRPLSTEDDVNELYAKVSFSKKRKNRMRSDSAAAIAMNKSRTPFVTVVHKDTDSLVENEAVVVYDERTAL
ncbi:uncharacterized protein [Parasteatoda tepidariorum]|uniref:uncharacterized protein n=1 Tax=Parasteatoda tepidariorum TaxID=114398 RepID=UPI00077F8C2B|nr:uncharacterized protein LOC107439715 [Parasteatoda tepidariorum]